MKTIELKGLDRFIPKIVYCLDKIGLKLRSRRILRFSCGLCGYIRAKYGVPRGRKAMMGMTYIEYEE
mgnify:FL=1